MSTDFSGRRVLITGATGGIGRHCATQFAELGANLVLVDRSTAALQELQNDLHGSVDVTALAGDLTDSGFLATVAQASSQNGGLDGFIPAAGIYRDAAIGDMTIDSWRETLSVNLDSVFELTRALLPNLRQDAAVVLFGSIAGSRGSATHAHYAATKAAVVAFGRSLAREVGHRGIRVNAVAPGIIRTPMTDGLVSSQGDDLLRQTPLVSSAVDSL
ncbi:SDR family NAD(P)-dependent oxidoreductase [Micrococcus terreus]|uniref:SDR family NAD(P)-dependent oxidoreductase n=1 Tax=Micrococcus terreus TaxID=574650 RepID=UPI00254C297A|nr:SDR family NAD(P)-dependent oxidoreductase [Micrococcus terreus]MDK7701102.1 SDR family NAD(P)-dependent oxidoreductase [Micrococcus terreus]WOO96860.1 SDR family NAD(P)-dependent oxidoreductase [Micrococcus terreus]